MARELLKGNHAIAEAAIRAGLEGYFGYPITPQTEVLEHLAKRMPELGRVFVQAESEIAAINMVYGAAATGARIMTSSSGPGVSLMMEGLSYIAGTELPMVLLNVMRGGPGLGNISPSQSDYYQAVKGGGHGDYRQIVLAPASVQEAVNLTSDAFNLAETYRSITILLIDGTLGQMMEPAELPEMRPISNTRPDWSLGNSKGRPRRSLNSFDLEPIRLEQMNLRRFLQWQQIEEKEVRFEEYYLDDAEFVVVSFGISGRIALTAVQAARAKGIKVGLLRPITLSPFPYKQIRELSKTVTNFLVLEMNVGQMLDDVRVAVDGKAPVHFYGRIGGIVPFPGEVLREIERLPKLGKALCDSPRDEWLNRVVKECLF